jgi:hypothetical protein
MSIADVTRELLVRHLDVWTPAALHSKRAAFVQAWAGEPDLPAAEAALRVFAEFADRLSGRQLTVIFIAPDTDGLTGVQSAAQLPAELGVHVVAGDGDDRIPAALKAAGAVRAPLLAYVDTAGTPPLSAIAAGRPAEALLLTPVRDWSAHRAALTAAGFPLTAGVHLVADADARLLALATSSAKSLEAFKNALWSVDEYAGVQYRDPRDPDSHLMDISLNPHPGPLRRELLAHLATVGEATVTELRHYTLTDTIYRASDTTRVVTALLTAGSVTRQPEHGRLSGDVVIAAA